MAGRQTDGANGGGVDPLRRSLLGYGLVTMGTAVTSCAPAPAPRPPPAPKPPPPIVIRTLTDLLPIAGLRWLVHLRAEPLLQLAWLKQPLGRVLRGERLDLWAATTGLDLRKLPELALAAYGADDVILVLARHRRDPLTVERLFRQRLTSDEHRAVDSEQLVRVSGLVGRLPRVFVALGGEVVGFQYGGDVERGPARIALLYAAGRLSRSPTITAEPFIAPLWAEVGSAPIRAALPGPFEGGLAQGARGLLAATTSVVAAAAPTAGESLALSILLGGDFSADPNRAREMLAAAWDDLAQSDLGHLLGVHQPRAEAQATVSPDRLRLDVAIDPAALFDGLAAATMDDIRQIMQ